MPVPNIYAVEIPVPLNLEAGFAVDAEKQIIYIQAWEPQALYDMLGYLAQAMLLRQVEVAKQFLEEADADD